MLPPAKTFHLRFTSGVEIDPTAQAWVAGRVAKRTRIGSFRSTTV
jgi:hypothetical protein